MRTLEFIATWMMLVCILLVFVANGLPPSEMSEGQLLYYKPAVGLFIASAIAFGFRVFLVKEE